jgi:hypothetical protein
VPVRRNEQGQRNRESEKASREDRNRGQLASREPVETSRSLLLDNALFLGVEEERAGCRARRTRHGKQIDALRAPLEANACFGDWHLRLITKRLSPSGGLRVQVIVPSLLGILTVLDAGTVSGTSTWAPSPRLQLLLSNVISLVGTRAVAFRFTPVGIGASYQIDDVYLDPWKCT